MQRPEIMNAIDNDGNGPEHPDDYSYAQHGVQI